MLYAELLFDHSISKKIVTLLVTSEL